MQAAKEDGGALAPTPDAIKVCPIRPGGVPDGVEADPLGQFPKDLPSYFFNEAARVLIAPSWSDTISKWHIIIDPYQSVGSSGHARRSDSPLGVTMYVLARVAFGSILNPAIAYSDPDNLPPI